jgi:hypothetical protein
MTTDQEIFNSELQNSLNLGLLKDNEVFDLIGSMLVRVMERKNGQFIELLNTMNKPSDLCFRCGFERSVSLTGYNYKKCSANGEDFNQHLFTLGPKQWKANVLNILNPKQNV